jgi:8-oxo-dGTP pyrophosphatase MutT (NUDIX family)
VKERQDDRDPMLDTQGVQAQVAGNDRIDRSRNKRRGRHHGGPPVPDILYHASTQRHLERSVTEGCLEHGGGRQVFLSIHDDHAWQVAHRLKEHPRLIVIDASRAQRAGVRFSRSRNGLWQARSIPSAFLLNTLENYGEQVSAGGFPLFFGERGPELLLIRVRRRSGITWEVAKGKLELGETPWQAAMREVQEEVGCEMQLSVFEDMGLIRYGFRTPEGYPRLKTVHIYLLETPDRKIDFDPAAAEGVEDVGWFTPDEAVKAVAHRSLRPMVWNVRRRLESRKLA